MATPSVTLRTLNNEDTGIDISVPHVLEEEAPLGGISVLYEISVLTTLNLFKTRLHKTEDVVHFTIFKAYREIEELYTKLNKKYPKAGLPPVPKSSTADKYTRDEKLEALDTFMQAVAKNVEICYSSTFTQFIGINSQRLPSFSTPKPNDCDTINLVNDENKKPDNEIQEVFPKMKNTSTEKSHNSSTYRSMPQSVKNADLFEEDKLVKSTKINENITKGGLFDEFEDESLFSVAAPKKAPTKPVEKAKATKVESKKQNTTFSQKGGPSVENIDDSQIIIKDRKPGDMSLFGAQDFGEYITKDEESLFLVTPSDEESKKNTLLFSNDRLPSSENDTSTNENLDDLLNLEPLPSAVSLIKKEEPEIITADRRASEPLPPKPVPRPRNKSVGKTENDSQQKPEVLPRKVFLNKPQVPSKPVLSSQHQVPAKMSKPAVQQKPSLPSKPKPPPIKPKPNAQKNNEKEIQALDAANANKPEETENLNTVSDLANDLNRLDILKYIEQEEKTLEANAGLFD